MLEGKLLYTPELVPWKSMVGTCISYIENGPFYGDMLVFGSAYSSWIIVFQMVALNIWRCRITQSLELQAYSIHTPSYARVDMQCWFVLFNYSREHWITKTQCLTFDCPASFFVRRKAPKLRIAPHVTGQQFESNSRQEMAEHVTSFFWNIQRRTWTLRWFSVFEGALQAFIRFLTTCELGFCSILKDR